MTSAALPAETRTGATEPPVAGHPITRAQWLALGIIVAVGAALRFAFIGRQSLWIDEIWHWTAARSIGAEGLAGVGRRDILTPLSHVVLWGSSKVLGTSDAALRVPSAVAGTLAIPLVFLVGRQWLSTRAGLLAAALTAISPFAIWYAQDVRAYPLALCLVCLILLGMHAAVRGAGRRWHWAALTLATAAGLYTHQYVTALLMAATGAFMIIAIRPWRAIFWKWLATQLVALALLIPWLVMVVRLLDEQTPGTAKGASLFWAPYAGYCYLFGFSLGPTVGELHGGAALQAVAEHLLLLGVLAVSSAWLMASTCLRLWRTGRRTILALCLACVLGPLILAMIAPAFTSISFNARYTTAALPPLFVLLAAAFERGRPAAVTMIAGAIVVAGMAWSTVNHLTDARYAKADLRSAAARLAEVMRPADVAIISSATAIGPLEHYGFAPTRHTFFVGPGPTVARPGERGADGAAGPVEVFGGPVAEALPRAIATAIGPAGRVHLLESRTWESDPRHEVAAVLASIGEREAEETWPGATLTRWSADASRVNRSINPP